MDDFVGTDRIYRVFVSSPFSLERLRAETLKAILTTNNMPLMIDLESAKQARSEDVIKKAISAADIYIILLGHKYGSLLPGEEISYTEWEYNLAQNSGLYTIHMLEKRGGVDKKRSLLDRAILKEKEELDNEDRYNKFYSRLEHSESLGNYWNESDLPGFAINLTSAIDHAAQYLRNEEPSKGLIPASYYKNINALGSSISNELRAEIHENFNLFNELDARCSHNLDAKKSVGAAFTDYFKELIIKNKVDLYFDSGSTASYVAQALGPHLKNSHYSRSRGRGYATRTYTCNALAYLHLWLKSGVPCSLYPVGPAEPPYGSTNGLLSNYGIDAARDPEYVDYALVPDEQKKVDELAKDFPSANKGGFLIIGGLSGIKIKNDFDSTTKEGFVLSQEIRNSIERYRGIHVGDYYSKLLKRVLIETGHPIVYCMHIEKFDYVFAIGKCHLVFDGPSQWHEYVSNSPVGLCVGYRDGEQKEAVSLVAKLGFDVLAYPISKSRQNQALIAGNKKFQKWIANHKNK